MPKKRTTGRTPVTIISLGRIWFATIGITLSIIVAWSCGLVDDALFRHRFLVWIPAIALTIDAWMRRAFPRLYGTHPFAEFED
jgi:hypothetical protein